MLKCGCAYDCANAFLVFYIFSLLHHIMNTQVFLEGGPSGGGAAPDELPDNLSVSEQSASELSALPTISDNAGEPLRHILLGTPGGVRQTIHLLHILRYAENALWSPLVPIPEDRLIITPRQGEVMSLLIRHLNN